ncbi:hypothetical protein ACFQAT_22650 [Undibacterium arcticum]|uniref:Uncharacterized protein n=1 Tax=Undibacterium arcticum TaxID=1762892 RepID=A0ABV7F204_9BURK
MTDNIFYTLAAKSPRWPDSDWIGGASTAVTGAEDADFNGAGRETVWSRRRGAMA